MFLILRALTALVIFCHLSLAQAAGNCREIFQRKPFYVSHHLRMQLIELDRNAIFPTLEMPLNADGTHNLWYLSRLENGERKSIVTKLDEQGNTLYISVRDTTPEMEKAFYQRIGPLLYEPLMEYIQLPTKGEYIVYISGAVQAKLWEKHTMDPRDVFKYIRMFPKTWDPFYTKSRTGLDSIDIVEYHVDLKIGTELKRFIAIFRNDLFNDPDVMELVTAYFKDKDHPGSEHD